MNSIVKFIKTTAIGGLLVIVPIAVVLFVLGELFFGLYSLAEDITGKLGIEINDAVIMVGIALLALIGLCFVTGLLVQTRVGVALKNWFYHHVGRRIPMFNAISSITKRFAGVEGLHFAPVEVDLYNTDARAMGFLVEALPSGRCAVFVPSAPVATVGSIYIVSRQKVTPIEASMTEAIAVITQWGVDAGDLYDGNREAGFGSDSGLK